MTTAVDERSPVLALQQRLHEVVRTVIAPGTRCALIGFPLHGGVGDSAIWLGQLAALRAAGARVVYACDRHSYDPAHLARALPAGTIVLQGGGTLGDVWWRGQRFRERVVAECPGHRIVQFPEWVYFREQASLERARAVFDRHPDLTILARDRQGFEQAREAFRARVLLCPDAAFGLGPLPRRSRPVRDIVWLRRDDRETAWPPPPEAPDVVAVDWRDEPPGAASRGARRLLTWLNRAQARRPVPTAARLALYVFIARRRLVWGRRLLSLGRVVVTERFHGYVLSLLLGLPHVLLDTRYGKIRRFYETWPLAEAGTRWARSPDDALDIARRLVPRAGGRRTR